MDIEIVDLPCKNGDIPCFSLCLPEGKLTHQPFVLSVAFSFCGESVVQQEENIPDMGCINNQTTWIRILCI